MRSILFTFFLVLFRVSLAQIDSLNQNAVNGEKTRAILSLTHKLQEDSARIYRFQKVRPYLSFDNRNSFINDQPVNFKGTQFGFIIQEQHIIGIGIYGMSQNSKKPLATREGTISAKKTISLNYITFFYEYALIEKKHFELDLPLEIGLGGYGVKLVDSLSGRILSDKKGGVIPIGVGIQPVYKPWSWLGITFLLGYRFVLDGNSNQNFNGLYYALGLSFDVRQVFRNSKYYLGKKRKYKKEVKRILNS